MEWGRRGRGPWVALRARAEFKMFMAVFSAWPIPISRERTCCARLSGKAAPDADARFDNGKESDCSNRVFRSRLCAPRAVKGLSVTEGAAVGNWEEYECEAPSYDFPPESPKPFNTV